MKRAFSQMAGVAHGVRSFSTTGHAIPANIVHSDLAYRALLRNLKLLKGLRADKTQFNVVITGVNADEVAVAMKRMEPALNFEIAGDSKSANLDYLTGKKDEEVDSVIVCQPYHTVHNAEQLAEIRRVLHDEDGTVGFIWHRATGQEEWVKLFAQTAHVARPELIKEMGEGDNAIAWMQRELPTEEFKFKPLKHRKFVEKLKGTHSDLLRVLPYISDARIPLGMPGAALSAGSAAVLSLEEAKAGAEAGVSMDLHAFHTQVLPQKKKD